MSASNSGINVTSDQLNADWKMAVRPVHVEGYPTAILVIFFGSVPQCKYHIGAEPNHFKDLKEKFLSPDIDKSRNVWISIWQVWVQRM